MRAKVILIKKIKKIKYDFEPHRDPFKVKIDDYCRKEALN